MAPVKEHIKHAKGDKEAWICLCGNTSTSDGFFPCDDDGNEVPPTKGWENLYVCGRCGRIIDQFSLEVIDQNPGFKRLE
jgi:hypothetical protein